MQTRVAAIYWLTAINTILVAWWKHASCLCYSIGARWFLRFLGSKLELPRTSAYSPYLRCLWFKLTVNSQIDWHLVCRITSMAYLDGWMNAIGWAVLVLKSILTSIEIGIIYGSVQRRHRYSKPPNEPIRSKYNTYITWCRKYNCAAACAG